MDTDRQYTVIASQRTCHTQPPIKDGLAVDRRGCLFLTYINDPPQRPSCRLLRIYLQKENRAISTLERRVSTMKDMIRSVLYFIVPWIAFVCMAFEKTKIRGISFAEAITSPFLIFLFVIGTLFAAVEVFREWNLRHRG